MRIFRDRHAAGCELAERLMHYARRPEALVLALPRGGVPVAYEIARRLGLDLDFILVRKLGVPGRPELAFGAIASGGARVLNEDVLLSLHIARATVEAVAAAEQRTLEQRERSYRGLSPRPSLHERVVILVDDGLATGASMRAAVRAVGASGPRRMIVAVPVAPPETCVQLAREVDEVVCVLTPAGFIGVSSWYEDFTQTTDDEVRELLTRAASRNGPPA